MRTALTLISAIVIACGAASAPPASTPATTAPATTAATTAPATSPARTTPPGTARPSLNPGFASVTLEWEAGTNVGDIDDVTDIVTHLKEKPGIEGGYGDELFIVVSYDPQKITVDQIRRLLTEMGFPTKAPRA